MRDSNRVDQRFPWGAGQEWRLQSYGLADATPGVGIISNFPKLGSHRKNIAPSQDPHEEEGRVKTDPISILLKISQA